MIFFQRKILALVSLGLLVFGSVFFYFQIYQKEELAPQKPVLKIHYYKNPAIPLDKIRLKVFYFIPRDRQDKILNDWQGALVQALDEIKKFHSFQFQGFSSIDFDIYLRLVIGLNNSIFYDTQDTSQGNPQALKSIFEEIEKRALQKDGDLYNREFIAKTPDEYQVLVFLYEGVGAVGSQEAVVLSRSFLTDDYYKTFGTSIFYHELLHSFGVPDRYDLLTNIPEADDITGIGRNKPLKITYLADEIKEEMIERQ